MAKRDVGLRRARCRDSSVYSVMCPHCSGDIEIERNQVNCGIFRHGVYKKTGALLDPHLPKKDWEILVKEDKIDGCGMPFRFDRVTRTVSACDWI